MIKFNVVARFTCDVEGCEACHETTVTDAHPMDDLWKFGKRIPKGWELVRTPAPKESMSPGFLKTVCPKCLKKVQKAKTKKEKNS